MPEHPAGGHYKNTPSAGEKQCKLAAVTVRPLRTKADRHYYRHQCPIRPSTKTRSHRPPRRARQPHPRDSQMKARIIVNRHIIRKNRKEGADVPSISVKTYRGIQYVHEVKFTGPAVLMSSTTPNLAASGATVWIEADYETLELFLREPPP